MKTYSAKPDSVVRNWYVIDMQGRNLGRTASRIALILRGKHKPEYTPHVDTGDCVIVINAGALTVTGKKLDDKIYYHHTLYPGGIKQTSLKDLLIKHPERAIMKAVKGMLPKNPLGRQMLSKLKVYTGSEHPHEAQQPQPLPENLEVK